MPAAGVGTRMGSEIPKQYLTVNGKTLLEHSLQGLLSHPRIKKIVIIIAKNDRHWPSIASTISQERIVTTYGGGERYLSVYAGLLNLTTFADPDDWVLVHDSVRPCVCGEDIDRLIATVENHAIGGLLAVPVRDTLKLTNEEGVVLNTVDRTRIWQAQTPQMFRLSVLTAALQQVINSQHPVTDEASAIEFSGGQPLVVPGHLDNIKVTYPEDLFWVKRYLKTLKGLCKNS